jgi:hypothetical protein
MDRLDVIQAECEREKKEKKKGPGRTTEKVDLDAFNPSFLQGWGSSWESHEAC